MERISVPFPMTKYSAKSTARVISDYIYDTNFKLNLAFKQINKMWQKTNFSKLEERKNITPAACLLGQQKMLR